MKDSQRVVLILGVPIVAIVAMWGVLQYQRTRAQEELAVLRATQMAKETPKLGTEGPGAQMPRNGEASAEEETPVSRPISLTAGAKSAPVSEDVDGDFAAYSRGNVRAERVESEWKVGDAWKVTTYYRQMQSPTDHWSKEPIVWNYRVLSCEEGIYRIEVSTDRAQGGIARATFFVTGGRRLLAMEDEVCEQGEMHPRRVEFEEGSTCAALTIIPFDLPSTAAEGNGLNSRVPCALPDPLLQEPVVTAPPASGKVVDVTFTNAFDGNEIIQRWDAAEPRWPIYSRTETRVSYLQR